MAVCTTFFSVVTGKVAVEKRYKTEPLKANTIDDFYNRMNTVRSRHGLGSIGKPSLIGTASLASSINTLYSSISSTGTSLGLAMPYGVSVTARNIIAGLSASHLEKDIATLEKKCVHNATNRSPNIRACVNNNSAFFSPVYATVFNPAAFQSLSLQKATFKKQEVRLSSIDASIRMNNVLTGIETMASLRASFSNDRSWFSGYSDNTCPDDSRNCSSNFFNDRGHNASDFGDRSHDGSDFGDFSNFSDFGANFGVVGSVYKCALNNVNNFANDNNANFVTFNASFCPTNYSPYRVEGIDF